MAENGEPPWFLADLADAAMRRSEQIVDGQIIPLVELFSAAVVKAKPETSVHGVALVALAARWLLRFPPERREEELRSFAKMVGVMLREAEDGGGR